MKLSKEQKIAKIIAISRGEIKANELNTNIIICRSLADIAHNLDKYKDEIEAGTVDLQCEPSLTELYEKNNPI
jgi:hypothetical protein